MIKLGDAFRLKNSSGKVAKPVNKKMAGQILAKKKAAMPSLGLPAVPKTKKAKTLPTTLASFNFRKK